MADATPTNTTPISTANQEVVESQTPEQTESTEETEVEASEEAPEVTPEPKKEEKKVNKKKFKLKVDGKEFDEEIDLDDENYLVSELQKAKAFAKRSNDFNQLQKDVEKFIGELRSNPKKVLSDPDLGVDIKKLFA